MQYPEYSGGSIPGVYAPDPTQSSAQRNQDYIVGQQSKNASDAWKNFQNNSDTLYRNYEDQSRQGLAKSISSAKQDASRRGLLYSGKTQSTISNLGAANRTDLTNARYGINQGLYNNAMNLQNSATQAGYNYAQSNPNMGQLVGNANQTAVQNALANYQNQNQLMSSVFSGVGQGAGYLASSGGGNQNQTPSYGNYGLMIYGSPSTSGGYGSYDTSDYNTFA